MSIELSEDSEATERRVRSVMAVGNVIRAISAMARAQLANVDAGAAEAASYLTWIESTISRLAGAQVFVPEQNSLTIVVGPERSFSGSLARDLANALPAQGRLGLVGTRLAQVVEGVEIDGSRIAFAVPGISSADELSRGARRVATTLLAHAGTDRVDVLYPLHNKDFGRVVLLAGVREKVAQPPETFSDPARILEVAVRESVSARLRVALAQALFVEVSVRVASAERARQAVERRHKELSQALRVLHDGEITTELLELHSGHIASEPWA